MTRGDDVDDMEIEYHGPTCAHPDCERRTLEIAIASAARRRRERPPKSNGIPFSPNCERLKEPLTWTW